jgi:hypothetical protein
VSRDVTFAENIFPFAQQNTNDTLTSTTTSNKPRFPFYFSPDLAPPAAAAEPATTSAVAPSAEIPVAANQTLPPSPAIDQIQPSTHSVDSPAAAAQNPQTSAAPPQLIQTTVEVAPSTQPPPPNAIPTTVPQNDHTMRTRAKSGFCLPVQRLNLHAEVSLSSLPKTYKSSLFDPN